MNRLSIDARAKIIGMLVEGNSIRATCRMADVSINTVTKLLVDIGIAAAAFHDKAVRNVRVRRLQCDEIWCFVGAKAKNVTPEQKAMGWGDVWTWTAIDADTKLCLSYLVGGRDAGWPLDGPRVDRRPADRAHPCRIAMGIDAKGGRRHPIACAPRLTFRKA